MPNAALAQHIAAAGLDVLVDLNGYSDQHRLPLFLCRSARLQVSWMGMYATTGVPEIDCLVGDDSVLPPEEEKFCCERVVRVPGSYLAFTVLYPVPEVAPPPSLASGRVTFGYLAAVTTSLELVTGIVILPQRQAVLVAKQAAEVDLLSQGRLRLR